MLIRVSIDGMTRHYCADCAGEAEALGQNVSEGHWVGKGWCYGCGLVGGGQGRRVKIRRPKRLDKSQRESEERLARALTGTGDKEE